MLILRIAKILSMLARFLVGNFTTYRQVVKLVENVELRILEEDVYLAMGFPWGSKPINERKKNEKRDDMQVKKR